MSSRLTIDNVWLGRCLENEITIWINLNEQEGIALWVDVFQICYLIRRLLIRPIFKCRTVDSAGFYLPPFLTWSQFLQLQLYKEPCWLYPKSLFSRLVLVIPNQNSTFWSSVSIERSQKRSFWPFTLSIKLYHFILCYRKVKHVNFWLFYFTRFWK